MPLPITTEPLFIEEKPADADAFSGGGHTRLAEEFARLVTNQRIRGGLVGVEGAWGSGKSSIIKLSVPFLANRADKLRTQTIITFDLWANQGTEFRRTVVAFLLNELRQTFPEESDWVKNKTAEVQGATKTTVKAAKKKYSLPAMYFILITPLLPLVFLYLSPQNFALSDNLRFFGSPLPNLIVSAILGLYLLILYRFVIHVLSNGNSSILAALASGMTDAISVFSRDADSETSTEETINVDPIKDNFSGIVTDILGRFSAHLSDIVLVIDNIDRLSADIVPLVWSDIYLLSTHFRQHFAKGEQPVIVVPYDRLHTLESLGLKEEKSDVISKTFDRVLKVAPPVIADWQDFTVSLLQEAFRGTLDSHEADRLSRSYYISVDKGDHLPTPRLIIAFVNEVSALWARWKGNIPIISIGLYISYKDALHSAPNISSTFPAMEINARAVSAPPDWRVHVCALAYNVDVAHATHLIFGPVIADQLPTRSSTKLDDYRLLPGFVRTLVQVIQENCDLWGASYDYFLGRAAENLLRLDLDVDVIPDSWRHLGEGLEKMPPLSPNDNDEENQIFLILSRQTSLRLEFLLPAIWRWWKDSVESVEMDDVSAGKRWAQFVLGSLNTVETIISTEQRKSVLKLAPLPSGGSVGMITSLASFIEAGVSYSDTSWEFTTQQLHNGLIVYSEEAGNSFDKISVDLSPYSTADEERAVLISVINSVKKRSASDTTQHFDVLSAIVQRYSVLKNDELDAVLTSIVKDGTLLAAAYKSRDTSTPTSLAAIVWIYVQLGRWITDPALTNSAHGDLAVQNEWFNGLLENYAALDIKVLVSLIEKTRGLHIWMPLLVHQPTFEFFSEIVRQVVFNRKFDILNVGFVFREYGLVHTVLGDDLSSKFLKRFEDWNQHYSDFVSTTGITALSPIFVRQAIKSRSKRFRFLIDLLDGAFQGATKDVWVADLSASGPLTKLLIERRSELGSHPTSSSLVDALITHATMLLDGSVATSELAPFWLNVTGAVQPRSRRRLTDGLYSKLVPAADVESWDRFYQHYGHLIDRMPLSRNASKTIDSLIIPMLNSEITDLGQFKELENVLASAFTTLGKGLKQRLNLAAEKALEGTEAQRAMATMIISDLKKAKRKSNTKV